MRKLLSTVCLAAALMLGGTTQASAEATFNMPRQWTGQTKAKTAKHQKAHERNVVTAPDGHLDGPTSSFGSLYTSDGKEWFYTAEFAEGETGYTGASFTIYNESMQKITALTTEFTLREHETGINFVQIHPVLTKKFYNYDESYEIMIFVHATTDDFSGKLYNKVYSLNSGKHICDIPGNCISMVDTAKNAWEENYTLVFMDEVFTEEDGEDKYYLEFNVYKKAGYGGGVSIAHTFKIDYQYVSGSGANSQPFIAKNIGGKIFYFMPYYEKTYFVEPNNPYNDAVNEDNNFIIEMYDEKFNPVKTTKIPMALDEGAVFTFPGIGNLMYDGDVDTEMFSDGTEPMYVVTHESYASAGSDEYIMNYYVYDTDGNRVNTIATDAMASMGLSDVRGYERQMCFIASDADGNQYFKVVDLPSCNEAAALPVQIDGDLLTMALDRIPTGNGYEYVISYGVALYDEENNSCTHRLAWFNADGSLNRVEGINLGEGIQDAQVYVDATAFSPFLFNTDNKREYMFLVKYRPYDQPTGRVTEQLRIYNEDSELLLVIGPDTERGMTLSSIFLSNLDINPVLVTVQMDQEWNYMFSYNNLPLSKFEAGGTGTAEDPYLITTAGDFMMIGSNPEAYYKVMNDISFAGVEFKGFDCNFTGVLDGNGFTISDMVITGSGIFDCISSKGMVKDMNLWQPVIEFNTTGDAGFIASMIMGGDSEVAVENVHIINPMAMGTCTYFGGIAGQLNVTGKIAQCSIVNADFAVKAEAAGGIAGSMRTGSVVEACLFTGEISAENVGGIVGSTSSGDELITNCHANGKFTGTVNAGGILGDSSRSIVSKCLAEGEVSVTSKGTAGAGGIVGRLEPNVEEGDAIVVEGCISAITLCEVNNQKGVAAAHRIVGLTSLDEGEIDWESPIFNDPDFEYSLENFPRLPGIPEKYIKDNYYIGSIAAVTEDVATSADGKTVDAVNAELLAQLGWAVGESLESPWAMTDNLPELWFEESAKHITGIDEAISNAVAKAIAFDGENVVAEGAIAVYSIDGTLVATGIDSVNVSAIAGGVYVAVSGSDVLKFVK